MLNKFLKKLRRKDILTELKNNGAKIGEKVIVYDEERTFIDMTRPWLISIGNYTKITRGVVILTHDYSLSVLRRVYGDWIGEGAETSIGENCFVGMNSIILMGTKIGNNCIVGAGSVVHGTFPDNVVIAGNPAKVICTLEEHYNKRKSRTIEEAQNCARIFYDRFKKLPRPSDLSGFKFLFEPREPEIVKSDNLNFNCTGDEPKEVETAFYSSKPHWESFEKFLDETINK